MGEDVANRFKPKRIKFYVGLAGIAGAAWLSYLIQRATWEPSDLGAVALFTFLLIVAGSFPLPVAPRVTADVTTAVLFGAALLLGPGAAALAAVVGKLTGNLLVRLWGDRLRLPGYRFPFHKYPFNMG